MIARFVEKWEVRPIIDPSFSHDPVTHLVPIVGSYVSSDEPPVQVLTLDELSAASESSETYSHKLLVALDLNQPVSFLLERLEDTLSVYQKMNVQERFGDLLNPQFAHLDQLLFVFDQMSVSDVHLEDVAKVCYESFDQANSGEQKKLLETLEAHYKEASHYVSNGLHLESSRDD